MDSQVMDVIVTINAFFQNITKRIEQIYDMYNANVDDGRIVFLVEDLNSLLDGINVICKECNFIDVDEYHEKLSLIVNAWEACDTLLLADVLAFELKPLLQYWSNRIEREWGIIQ